MFFGRHFVDGSAVLVGNSQIAISLNNLAAHTLNKYHEFLWWDPTGLNGYPALVNLTHGWFNYLNPLMLPGHLFVWTVTSLLHWPLVTAVQVQLFSIAYLTALVFVILLSRELIRSPVARLFPPLVFTLGASANQFLMLAQHGPALAPSLAYLFGLIYFWRRRTPSSLFVFLALAFVLRRLHQLHHILKSSVSAAPVHNLSCRVQPRCSGPRLGSIARGNGNDPG